MCDTQKKFYARHLSNIAHRLYIYKANVFITKEGLFRRIAVQMLQQLTTAVIPGELQRFA